VNARYYDAVILGLDVAPLACGALLAKRGFRVLVLGQEQAPPEYRVGNHRLPARPFTFTAARSPLTARVFGELGLSQNLRRMSSALYPAFQVAMPGHRFDVSAADGVLEREFERELPEVKRPVLDFHQQVHDRAAASDALFETDLSWPPESFLEKRELARIAARLPFTRGGRGHDALGELPETHPFRSAAIAPAAFDSSLDAESLSQLQLARLYAGRYLGATRFEGGLPALTELLLDKVRTHSGEVRLEERAHEIVVRRAGVSGVRLFGSEEEIGGRAIVAGLDVTSVQRMLSDRTAFERLFERVGEPQPRYYRYTLNAVIDAQSVPPGMASQLYLVRDARRPLREDNLLHVQLSTLDGDESLLTIEAILPVRRVENRDGYLQDMRETLMDAVRDVVPFVGEHLRLLDSPHDGREPWARDEGANLTLEPRARRGPATMRTVWAFPVSRALSLCAMPVKTPLRGLLLCNTQVAPGLGLEGELLAALSAARVVTREDRSKEWMRRRLWTKVEI
jgi:phytoene dehydrogenase-like protein